MTDPKPVELTEAERDSLIVFDTGIYACAAEGYCSGYDHSQPGHDHEDIYDAVARIKAAARREALLEVESRLQPPPPWPASDKKVANDRGYAAGWCDALAVVEELRTEESA